MILNVQHRQAITAHFIHHWGPPSDISVRLLNSDEFAILEFPPSRGRVGYQFATNGMSQYVQQDSDGSFRTELYISSSERYDWIPELLAALVRYPLDYGCVLAPFDTIALGQPIVFGALSYTALLLAPPEPETLGMVPGLTTESLLVHRVVLITARECEHAQQHGGQMLWERLTAQEMPLLVDQIRPEVLVL